MGAKTTQFIADIEADQKTCKTEIDTYLKARAEYEKLVPLAPQLGDKLTARFNVLMKQNKGSYAVVQPLLFTDPEYVKWDKMADQICKQIAAHAATSRRSRSNLLIALSSMKVRLKRFEDFINKKEKSKNPFKSKKSLPAAKDFITASKVFHDNTTSVLTEFKELD